MSSLERLFAASPETDSEHVFEALAERFSVVTTDDAEQVVTYFDTFDWRLYRDGGVLSLSSDRRGPNAAWRSFDGTLRHRLATSEMPAFAGDFPAGSFRSAVEPILAMRRLLPVVELRLTGRTLRLLDRREKTVARLRLEEGTAIDRRPAEPEARRAAEAVALPPVLRVLPVRGYTKHCQRLIAALEDDLGLEAAAGSQLERGLAAVGREPADYSSKAGRQLDPELPAAAAAKAAHRAMLEVMRRNEAGTREDLDSEFLHDFRVAVRRTRSILTQVKGVFPPKELRRFKSELSWLGGLTGPTRDLDVYLLKMGAYRDQLPPEVSRHLAPLEAHLVAEQQRAQRAMVKQLDSPRYEALIESWDRFLSRPADLEAGPNAGRPIVEVTSQRIWKIYRRVIKEGLAIDSETPADAVHQLRIDCKKLRYLMELFRSLYPQRELERLIKVLKKLQDNLGDFNDYEVQQGSIAGFAEAMARQGSAPARTLMAMGRLVERLEAGQARERALVEKRFAKFARDEYRQLARELFAPSEADFGV